MTIQDVGAAGPRDNLWEKFHSILNPTVVETPPLRDKKWKNFTDEGSISIHDLLEVADTDDIDNVLLIDYRPRHLFSENHITLFDNIVNIDPSFVKIGYSLLDLCTNTMVLNPSVEKEMIREIKKWELVIVLDQQSSIDDDSGISHQLTVFLNILKKDNIAAVVLNGGFNEWEMFMDGKVSQRLIEDPSPSPVVANPKIVPINSTVTQASKSVIHKVPQPLMIQTGLINLGNTCYMNAALQCLVHTDLFSKYITHGKFNAKLQLTNEYRNLLNLMVSNTKKGVPTNAKHFKKLLGTLNPQFKGFDQQDSSEFLHFVLDSIHEELNTSSGVPPQSPLSQEEELEREKMPLKLSSSLAWDAFSKRNNSMVVDTFCGQYSSKLQCWKCHFTSTTFIPFTMLSLPIPKMDKGVTVDAYDCLDSFTKPEKLIGDNSWKCPRCGEQKASLKKLTITRLPKVLIIHLERFKYNISGGFEKDNRVVQFDDNLEMGGYLISDEGLLQKYKLKSFVSHNGTLTSGHYKAASSKMVFDDDRVSSKGAERLSDGAFVVFYERIA